ncbi:hypothetical protein QJS10_CPA06g02271 [Acorus calamus]|uniref:Transmembrane protein n=1 Tax=Acorus calamus TaxID=4465 RepID=A0AAV9EN34_ACOCL|nr:hypothetical protein QJS10_CPA06g02271 [Acorus calamus]
MTNIYYHPNSHYSSSSSPAIPIHLCFFLFTLLTFMGLTWYVNYESVMESLIDQMRLAVALSPLVLLFVVHYLSGEDRRRVPFMVSLPEERESLHRAGGSPWGVGLLLVLLLLMVSYQSHFHHRWFPLLSR